MLTEQSRERAACVLISRRCGSTNDHRDSLKFVQEVARFVTSLFFGKKVTLGVWKVATLATLRASLLLTPLCLTAAAHAFSNVHTRTGISGPRPIRGGGPPFTISDWFRPRYGPNVSVVESQGDFQSRVDQIGRTLEPCITLHWIRKQKW